MVATSAPSRAVGLCIAPPTARESVLPSRLQIAPDRHMRTALGQLSGETNQISQTDATHAEQAVRADQLPGCAPVQPPLYRLLNHETFAEDMTFGWRITCIQFEALPPLSFMGRCAKWMTFEAPSPRPAQDDRRGSATHGSDSGIRTGVLRGAGSACRAVLAFQAAATRISSSHGSGRGHRRNRWHLCQASVCYPAV